MEFLNVINPLYNNYKQLQNVFKLFIGALTCNKPIEHMASFVSYWIKQISKAQSKRESNDSSFSSEVLDTFILSLFYFNPPG